MTDPSCGMRVDRSRAGVKELGGQRFYFYSEHCAHAFMTERRVLTAPADARDVTSGSTWPVNISE